MGAPLAGRIPIEINYVPAVTAEDVTVNMSQGQKVRIGAYGPYGRAQGQRTYDITIKFGIPQERAEFEQLADNARGQIPGQEGFDVTYHKGSETYTLTDCGINTDSVNSDQNGEAAQNVKIVAVDRIKVS